ncbi:NUMOD1 domain-containing DNA-binding protein [Chryseolinea lacunae]|uniref:Nuclease-associated modular DNA-binding 1 domain-containing protein n=1 Tax=Chryseolinea lacunae TaxID=2801331 RepID=A0ABS1L2A8_9BACT|nr:NUMOD1 domain-containing DNA-binding protein [Chryseolinea lacunae]MBL0745846.1 hypothetical protein [Chryseolinea lacunae]
MNKIPDRTLKSDKDYDRYPFRNLSLENMKGEKWLDVPGFDGHLAVSNYGRVWMLSQEIRKATGKVCPAKECIRKQVMSRRYNPYTKDYMEQLAVNVRYNGRRLRALVNRLVYQVFVAPIDFKEDHLRVVHRDGDNCNNHYKNLVLMDGVHVYRHVLHIGRLPKSGTTKKKGQPRTGKNAERPIIQYSLDGKKIAEFESIAMASKATGTHRVSVRRAAQKKVLQLRGFVYRYKGDYYGGEQSGFSRERPVTQYSIAGEKIARFLSVTEAARATKISGKTISGAALRKFRFGSGYVWRYDGETYDGELKDTIRNRPKGIVQYTPEGLRVARYDSVNQACKATGFCNTALLHCASKQSKLSYGFVWRFENEDYQGEYGCFAQKIKKNPRAKNKRDGARARRYAVAPARMSSSFRPSRGARNGKEVVQYALSGKVIKKYSSLAEAAKACAIDTSGISTVLDKPKRSAGGFVWRTKGNRYFGELAKTPSQNKARAVTQYDRDGRKLAEFRSGQEAERRTGVTSSSISAAATGKCRTAGGFVWRYGKVVEKLNLETLQGSALAKLKRVSKSIYKYSIDGERLGEFPSLSAASRSEGIQVSCISSVIHGRSKSAGGFLWRLK